MTIVPTPDSPLVGAFLPSPNHGERRGFARPDSVILHYTGMATTQAALERLCDPGPQVSSHYLVFEDGAIVQLVPEARRAYHAGESSWEGATDINSRSVGIEIGNQGHDYGSPAYPEAQIAAVNNFIDSGYDAIIVNANSTSAFGSCNRSSA